MLKNMSAQMLRYGSILEKQRKRAQSGARLHLSSSKQAGGGVFKNKYESHHYGLSQNADSDAILSQIRKDRKKKVGHSQDYAGLPVIKSSYETGGDRQKHMKAKVEFR